MNSRTTASSYDNEDSQLQEQQQQQDKKTIDALQDEILQLQKDRDQADAEHNRFKAEKTQLEEEETRNTARLKELQIPIQSIKVEQAKLDDDMKELEKEQAKLFGLVWHCSSIV
jgi:chromosome segregation ATPase